ncbi:uncharacterized protein PHALS_05661 [Plasmopara halstedii]|uniref:Uncharacterized protein n=1 Tax=Plasmopara halstedii TaxID=4781 RepID=A0A0P1B2X1_PLAHL|nr:uncharacterized protein PHALS_05661 [Plasmopara halstedii]CEG48191.1 hypothetical protein PHALS_05661 [Plasmopara halstedii]|eukprot:XP_024584560.1 hypothetical protein PHALS_05661 [Plasmopara halstedii]
MLAEVARRRSSWLRSLPAAQHLPRTLQLYATFQPCEKRKTGPRVMVRKDLRSLGDKSQSLDAHLQLHVSGDCNALIGADLKSQTEEPFEGKKKVVRQPVILPADAEAGVFPSLIASASPAEFDLNRARDSLQNMRSDLMDRRLAVMKESRYQRARRRLKAATGKLDRMLYAMCQQQDYQQVEAVAFLWEKEFPQFAGQRKHWSVISEHYALVLNCQQRFQDVVNKFSFCYKEEDQSADNLSVLTPRLAQSIFVALGHLRDAAGALKLLDTMQHRGIHVTKVSYFHALNALLHDQTFTDFECVLQLCEEIVTKLPGENVPLSLLPMVMMTAAACGESERAMKFYSHPPDLPMSIFTEFRFDVCLQQLAHLGEDKMVMEIYRNVMASRKASRDLKQRVSKFLFKKQLVLVTTNSRCKRLGAACIILKIMNKHQILVSHHAIYPLMRALFLKPLPVYHINSVIDAKDDQKFHFRVQSAEDLHNFFLQFSNSLKWNEFALCEAVIAAVRADRADLVDSLCVYALNNCISIKYAALEQMVVYYYRSGLINDLERVSTMVRALRLNKHIPLGIAVTEIGMTANFRLHRYEEVVMLFEDFSSLDGERRRVLTRKFMLRTVLEAYKNLGLSDKAMAIQELLRQHQSSLLDSSDFFGEDELMATSLRNDDVSATITSEDSEDSADYYNCTGKIGEQERVALQGLDRYKSH